MLGDPDTIPSIHTPEHREALARRHGRPEGAHVRTDGKGPQSMSTADRSDLVKLFEELKGPPKPTGLRFDWSINFGHIATILVIVSGLFGAYYGIKMEMQDAASKVEMLAARVTNIERGRVENIPRLDALIRANEIQDERITNLTAGLTILRQTVADQGKNIVELTNLIHDAHEREAVLEERVTHGLPDARGR